MNCAFTCLKKDGISQEVVATESRQRGTHKIRTLGDLYFVAQNLKCCFGSVCAAQAVYSPAGVTKTG